MRRYGIALALAAAVLAGCGGGHTAAKSNGEASKPATKVLADAESAAKNASSMHVSGNIRSSGTPITLDLTIVSDKGAKGSMSTNGLSFNLVRVGNSFYIQGSDAFYRKFGGQAVAHLLHGKWLKGSATHGQLASLAPLTSIGALFSAISASHGKLANEGATTYQGQSVVEIRDTSDNSKLYVAATGTPYPVALVGGKASQSGAITFGDWNKSESLSAPSGSIDISKLGTG